jgi:hypothetical protein
VHQLLGSIPRPRSGPHLSCPRCHLYLQDESLLHVAWANAIKVCRLEVPKGRGDGLGGGGGGSASGAVGGAGGGGGGLRTLTTVASLQTDYLCLVRGWRGRVKRFLGGGCGREGGRGRSCGQRDQWGEGRVRGHGILGNFSPLFCFDLLLPFPLYRVIQ